MLRGMIVAVMLFSLGSGASASGMTLLFKDYKAPQDETEKFLYEMYFDGVTEGVRELNVVMQAEGRQPLFCQPQKLALTVEQAEDIMMRTAQAMTNPDTTPIGILLILGLRETFPCNEKH